MRGPDRMHKNSSDNRHRWPARGDRPLIHALVWVWSGVVLILPLIQVVAGWFYVYLVLVNFVAGTAAVCAMRWWLRRRDSKPPPVS